MFLLNFDVSSAEERKLKFGIDLARNWIYISPRGEKLIGGGRNFYPSDIRGGGGELTVCAIAGRSSSDPSCSGAGVPEVVITRPDPSLPRTLAEQRWLKVV